MDTEITLRKKAVKLWVRGLSKSEIARRSHRPRLWVQRWINCQDPSATEGSLQNRSRAPQHVQERYPRRVKESVLRSRKERAARKCSKYKHAQIDVDDISYELQELGITPLHPPRTSYAWLKQAYEVKERKAKARQLPNPTSPHDMDYGYRRSDFHWIAPIFAKLVWSFG
jgi:transposase